MNIPKASINIGILLTLLGIISYFLTDAASITALIPSFFGIVFAGLGFLAKRNESMRKHAMHAALLLSLLGLSGSFSGLMALTGVLSGIMPERMNAAVSQSIMAVLCIIFLIVGVKSFVAARKADKNEKG